MVSVESAGGAPVRVSGAALAGGPLLALAPQRRLFDVARVGSAAGSAFQGWFRGASIEQPDSTGQAPLAELAMPREVLPAQWGIPAFYAEALYGPPYELLNRTAEWALSAETLAPFQPVNLQARMALRVHPRGPALQSAGTFLAALYGTAPTPRHLGVGVDALG